MAGPRLLSCQRMDRPSTSGPRCGTSAECRNLSAPFGPVPRRIIAPRIMLILHGAWSDGRSLVWGETAPAGAPRRRKAVYSPFDPGAKPLAAVERFAGALPKISEMVAWLPSHREGPSPSSPPIGEAPASKGAYPAPWIVVAVALEGDVRDALLAHCAARRTEGQNLLDTGIVIGDDLAFFAEAARFAWSLAAPQRFLPTAVRTPEGLRHAGARPLPVRMPSDSTTWQRPCRASSTADADTGRAARGVAFRAVRSSGSLLRPHD